MAKIKNIIKAIIVIIITCNFLAVAQQKIEWNGYLQFRFTDNYLNQSNFSIRRAKFWVKGILPVDNGNWSYKLQTNFLKQGNYQLLLQDALVSYRLSNIEITAGQFVPDFSLQRKQPDYQIPLLERAQVVNALVPGAETMARDIGIELKIDENETGSFSLGFFNGNGANNVSNNRNFLFVNHGKVFLLNTHTSKLELGYNLSYRDAHNYQFSKIFGSNYTFTGNDFRFGFEGKLNLGNFELQSEYITAHLGSQKAEGFYALVDYLYASNHLFTLSVGQLKDLNPSTTDDPWYVVGYCYLLKGNKIKFSLDNSFQFVTDKTNVLTTIQIQYFFK